MKGMSTVVATILMLAITIALSGTAYLYISGIIFGKISTSFSIIDSYQSSVTIMNDGSSTITSFSSVKVDGADAIYRVSTQDDSMTGYYKFGEGSGTTADDSSGKGNTGTIYGATPVDGYYGKSLSFDGNDYVDIADSSLYFSDAVTEDKWTNTDDILKYGKVLSFDSVVNSNTDSFPNGNTYSDYIRFPDANDANILDGSIKRISFDGIDPTLEINVSVGADDVQRVGATFFSPTTGSFDVGNVGGNINHVAARFINITIPQGSIITNAYLSVAARSNASAGSNVQTRVYAENVDSATQITSYTDFDGRSLTVGTDWDITASWITGPRYNSTNISSEIQAVVNRAGWASGNSINIFWKDNGSVSGNYRIVAAFESPLYPEPLLYIGYIVAAGDTTPPTRTNGQPTGTLPAGTTSTNISLTATDSTPPVSCRYSTTPNTLYSSMTNTLSNIGGNSYSTLITGLTNGSTYNYYVRCQDSLGNTNTDDFNISFSVASAGTSFTFIADITTEETALGMVEYNNDLYVAAHTNPKNNGPGTIIRYNDSTGIYETVYNIPSGEGLGDIRVLNGRIYVTSLDFSGNNAGWIYNGSTWQQWTMSGPAGLLDIDYYNNRYYAAGYGGPSAGTPTLYSSLNGVTGWSDTYNISDQVNRFSQITIFNGKMYFTPQVSNVITAGGLGTVLDTDIFSYDGTTFTQIEISIYPMEITDMEVFNNALYLSLWNGSSTNVPGMYRTTDGTNFSIVSFFGPSPTKSPRLSDLITYNNKLYAAEYVLGPPTQVIVYESSDGTNWSQFGSVSATASVYGNGSWYNHVALGVYNGRLYLIPPAEGRLYIVQVAADITPPVRSNGQPTGTLATGTTQTIMNLTTDESATCRYSTTAGIAYGAMINTFSTTGSTIHSQLITGLTNGNNYNYYVKCNDTVGNLNPNDFNISFSVASLIDTTPPARSNPQPSGTLPAGTTSTNISLTATDTTPPVSCRYSNTAGTAYSSMTNTLSNIGGSTYSATVSGLINGNTYYYYVRCIDTVGNNNTNDFPISFSVASGGAIQPSNHTAVTIEAWINPASTGTRYILANPYLNTQNSKYAIYVAPNGTLGVAQTSTSGSWNEVRGGVNSVPNGIWTHVAYTWDATGGLARYYINGNLVGTRADAGTVLGLGGDIRMGSHAYISNGYFNGIIDEVRIYNRSLPEQEIKANFEIGSQINSGQLSTIEIYNNLTAGIHTLRICTSNLCSTAYLTIV